MKRRRCRLGSSTCADTVERAIAKFGLTDDVREAGYVLPDGDVLDFSGKRDGHEEGQRNYDHDRIALVAPPSTYESNRGVAAETQFMARCCAVRVTVGHQWPPQGLSVESFCAPTAAQMRTLRDLAEQAGGFVRADRMRTGGDYGEIVRVGAPRTMAELRRLLRDS